MDGDKKGQRLKAPGTTTLVLGDVMLDHYIEGKVERISPEAPVPVVHVQRDRYMLGGAGNVAANLRGLECPVILGGVGGEDIEGQHLLQLLENQDIAHCMQFNGTQTITKTRVIAGRQQIARIDREDHQAHTPIAITSLDDKLAWDQIGQIVLSDYLKGSLQPDNLGAIFQLARQHRIPVLVDPKGHDWEKYTGAMVLTPNLRELALVNGAALDNNKDDAISGAAHAIREHFQFEHLLVTRSEKGMTLVSAGGATRHFRTQAQDVFDVTGAGDTVLATLAFGFSLGMKLERSVEMANFAAGLSVAHLGAYRVSRKELRDFL